MSLKKEDIVEVKEKDDNGELDRLPFTLLLDTDQSLCFSFFQDGGSLSKMDRKDGLPREFERLEKPQPPHLFAFASRR